MMNHFFLRFLGAYILPLLLHPILDLACRRHDLLLLRHHHHYSQVSLRFLIFYLHLVLCSQEKQAATVPMPSNGHTGADTANISKKNNKLQNNLRKGKNQFVH